MQQPIIVTKIIDAETIEVNQWYLKGPNNYTGTIVKMTGFEGHNHKLTIDKLSILLFENNEGRLITLQNAKKIKMSDDNSSNTVWCSVYLNDINIRRYFPEFDTNFNTKNKPSFLRCIFNKFIDFFN